MKMSLTVAVAASLVLLASAAGAQNADKHSFFYGFWSNEGFVAQPQVYPRPLWVPHYDSNPEMNSPRNGGYVLHERNW